MNFPLSSSEPNLMYTETLFYVEHLLCIRYEYEVGQFDLGVVGKTNKTKLPLLRSALQ